MDMDSCDVVWKKGGKSEDRTALITVRERKRETETETETEEAQVSMLLNSAVSV